MYLLSGQSAILRGVGWNKLWWAIPVTVVQDTVNLNALYWPAGTKGKNTVRRPTIDDLLHPEQLAIGDTKWTRTDVLMLTIPEESFSIYVMWQAGHTMLDCWYINIQDALKRTKIGFDTMDHMLDIVVSPDMSEWQWKDEDEFSEAESKGIYSTDEAEQIRSAGVKAIEALRGDRRDFYERWQYWKPPAEWQIPSLTANWDKI